jgi:hypothetical protein
VRWGGAAALAPIPGPFDEAAMLLVGGVLWLCYRDELREAWQRTAQIPNTPGSLRDSARPSRPSAQDSPGSSVS